MEKQVEALTSAELLKLWKSLLSWPVWVLFFISYILLYLFVDKPVATYFHSNEYFQIFNFLNFLGSGYVYVILFAMLALYFRYIRASKTYAKQMTLLSIWVLSSYTLCGVLKVLIGRARPRLWFSDHLYGFYGLKFSQSYWSFPSGHTTTFIAVTVGLAYLFPRYWKLSIITGVLLSFSRVMLYQHYLSDVLGTFFLTFIFFVTTMDWLDSRRRSSNS